MLKKIGLLLVVIYLNLFCHNTAIAAEITQAYWWNNSEGNTNFNETDDVTLAIKTTGMNTGDTVIFDIHEDDLFNGFCGGDKVHSIATTIPDIDANGEFISTVVWEANYFNGIFEDYPNKAEYCFIGTTGGRNCNAATNRGYTLGKAVGPGWLSPSISYWIAG